MSWSILVETIGYLGSGLIVVSILQRSILRLRVLGVLGSFTFLAYALLIDAYPIAALNVVGAAIHIWHLRKLTRHKEEVFRFLHVRPESKYLLDFLDFYDDEIKVGLQPEFTHRPGPRQISVFIVRDMVPAGLLIGQLGDDGTLEVELDFAIPQYRDFKIGRFVYSADSEMLKNYNLRRVTSNASDADHARYLTRMGFTQVAETPDRYELTSPRSAKASSRF